MNEKNLLIEAIEQDSFYTKTQRRLLKSLVDLEENYIIKCTVFELSQLSGMSRASVYRCIELLNKENVIEIKNTTSNTLSLFSLNNVKLEEIKKNYLKKLSLRKNEKIMQK